MEGIKNWNVLLNSNSQRQHKIDEEFFEVREWRNRKYQSKSCSSVYKEQQRQMAEKFAASRWP